MRIGILTSYFFHECKEVYEKAAEQGLISKEAIKDDLIIFGGAERYMVELVDLLNQLGHQVTVFQPLDNYVTVNGARQRVDTGAIFKKYNGIEFVCIPDTAWDLNCNVELNRIFNENMAHYDFAIYFTTFLAYPYVVQPSISVCHGIYWDYSYHGVKQWTRERQDKFWKSQFYGFTSPNACVAVDSNVKRVIAAMDPGSERNIEVIPNFVDTKKFKPAGHLWDGNPPWEGIKVLFPRRLTTLRGSNEFIAASKKMPQYQFITVGQSRNQSTNEKMAEFADKSGNLTSTWKPMDEMVEVYQEADIAVIPTRACEGLSLSLLESMACGLPVITTPVGGLGDATIDCYNAFICDLQRDNLADYIYTLAQNKQLREVMGKRNRDITLCSFDIDLWRGRWERLLRHLGA